MAAGCVVHWLTGHAVALCHAPQVRIRKENQVYSAEEKAALAMFNFEVSGHVH
jgi:hypothetical protein